MPPFSEQDSDVELQTEQRKDQNVPQLCIMYDDIILSTSIDLNLPPKPDQPIVMYDDILSQSEQDLKQSSSASKPKVMYDEVVQPCMQDHVLLKKNTA